MHIRIMSCSKESGHLLEQDYTMTPMTRLVTSTCIICTILYKTITHVHTQLQPTLMSPGMSLAKTCGFKPLLAVGSPERAAFASSLRIRSAKYFTSLTGSMMLQSSRLVEMDTIPVLVL